MSFRVIVEKFPNLHNRKLNRENSVKPMRNFRIYMIFQWAFFLPIILPLCIIFGALRGIVQMVERVMEQIISDVMPSEQTTTFTER
ncbi:hypothetical protein BH09BAC4_BH09BAC4_38100 [soil metagenome]